MISSPGLSFPPNCIQISGRTRLAPGAADPKPNFPPIFRRKPNFMGQSASFPETQAQQPQVRRTLQPYVTPSPIPGPRAPEIFRGHFYPAPSPIPGPNAPEIFRGHYYPAPSPIPGPNAPEIFQDRFFPAPTPIPGPESTELFSTHWDEKEKDEVEKEEQHEM
ncbi:hypothetical protein PAPYR_1494 [Paratrimastix pyriformis]|uniref:Uncharacterized protein n=1 Tax=Paratrimastix pyriformis TaxID=342808 RepID=A0ABQ8UTT4_9EUKA|nr:hypothetical protein PAPYR_1494 [Paratrimastix pyriformis]